MCAHKRVAFPLTPPNGGLQRYLGAGSTGWLESQDPT
jgi:hypothetical protein